MWCRDIRLVLWRCLLAMSPLQQRGEQCEPDPWSWNPFSAQGGFTQALPKPPELSPPQPQGSGADWVKMLTVLPKRGFPSPFKSWGSPALLTAPSPVLGSCGVSLLPAPK